MTALAVYPTFLQSLFGSPRSKTRPPTHKRRTPRGPKEIALDQHYSIINRVGSGCMGTVYQAQHRRTNHLVAVKLIPRVDLRTPLDELSVRREVHALQSLSHPNILRLKHVRSDSQFIYLATEFCANGDLFSMLDRTSIPLDEHEAIGYISDILHALAYMHGRGFAHRDIKLENILLTADGTVRLADFGLAYYRKPSDTDTTTTRRCGSLHYIAPEVYKGGAYVPSCADIWATGITLIALLTRTLPFNGNTPTQLSEQVKAFNPISFSRHDSVKHISKETKRLLRRMLSVDPEERATAAEAALMCNEILTAHSR